MTEEFRTILISELDRRVGKNPSYSKRAFARDLGISKSSLHDFLNGNRGISRKSLNQVIDALGITEQEVETLLDYGNRHLIDENKFAQICHWWFFAILALSEVDSIPAKPSSVAKTLEIDEDRVKEALQILTDLGFIEIRNDKIHRLTKSLATLTDIPSRSLKIFHAGNLERAENKLFSSPMEERDFSSITAAIDEEQYLKIKNEVKLFRNRLTKIIDEKSKPTRVYTFAIQVFPQSQTIGENK